MKTRHNMAARLKLMRKRKPVSDPEKRVCRGKLPDGPQTTLAGKIYCKHCAQKYPWPPGSREEARLYRVFLLNEDEKSFFCDPDCYWDYNYPSDSTEGEKEAARYGLPTNCGIDWDAKLKPPGECWEYVEREEGESMEEGPDDGGAVAMQDVPGDGIHAT